jgi:arylsulfatase A-like enzyme
MPKTETPMTRRTFLSTLAAGAGACAMGTGASAAYDPDASHPNVLFIAVDDLNDWVGCLGGHPDTLTPNIDRLAARGTLFTRAYCAAPACGPSRASVMTGIRPSTSGIYGNSQPFRHSPVLAHATTMPSYFRAHGYRVEGAGKIYHTLHPDRRSWDDYFPSKHATQPPDILAPDAPLNGIPETAHFDWGAVHVEQDEMADSAVADWVSGRLSAHHDRPFFLACGFYRPHLPWYVPQEYFDRFPLDDITLPDVKEDDLDDIPEAGRRVANPGRDHAKVTEHDQWRQAVQGYLASIAFADDCVGRVLDALDNGPHRDNTIVVLWSDHGWHLGEKLHWRKFALWEEATRNVLTISAPGVTGPGTTSGATVSLLDLYPTLAELCNLAPKAELEGDSLVPLLRDPNAAWDRPALTTLSRGNHSVRSERWRYIWYADGSEELYDHEQDPMEWRNLATDPRYADIIRDLARRLPDTEAPAVPGEPRESQLMRLKTMAVPLP